MKGEGQVHGVKTVGVAEDLYGVPSRCCSNVDNTWWPSRLSLLLLLLLLLLMMMMLMLMMVVISVSHSVINTT